MSKKIVVLILSLALVAGISPLSIAFETIPANHWAAEAVQSLNAEGVLLGYPDGTFKGNQAATRFELALALKRLENVVQGLSVSGQIQGSSLAEIRDLIAKLGEEVAKLEDATIALQDQANQAERAQARRDQFLNDVTDRLLALEQKSDPVAASNLLERVAALEKAYAELNDRTTKLSDQVSKLDIPTESKVKEWMKPELGALQTQLAGQLKGIQSQVDKLAQDNAALKAESENQKKTINRLYWLLGLGVAAGIAIK